MMTAFSFIISNILPILGSSTIIALIMNLFLQRMKSKTELESKKMEIDTSVKIHTDDLAIKLLEAAEKRVSHWQEENTRLGIEVSNLRKELKEAQTAINHLKRILYASSDKERIKAEEVAKLFLTKIDSNFYIDK